MIGLGLGLSKAKYTASVPGDVTAPTVVSATMSDTNKDGLVVVFSEAVNVTNVTGLSLDGTMAGVSVTAIESGNGTDTVTFTLSANLSYNESGNFVYGGTNTIEDLSGNPLASGSTAVTLNISLTAEIVPDWNFDGTGQWSLGTGDTISGGQLVATGTTTSQTIDGGLVTGSVGDVYYVVVKIDTVNSGFTKIGLGGGSDFTANLSTVGTHAQYIVRTNTAGNVIVDNRTVIGAFSGAIDYVSVKKLTNYP